MFVSVLFFVMELQVFLCQCGICGSSLVHEYHLRMKYVWVRYFADVLAVAGSHSVNPLIYGILDKQLQAFWKCCCKRKQKTQESQAAVVVLGETRTAHKLHAL